MKNTGLFGIYNHNYNPSSRGKIYGRLEKIFLNAILIFFLVILQISFLSNWPYLSYLNLILCLVIYFSLKNYHLALLWAVCGGFFLELFSPQPAGAFIFSFLVLSVVINFLTKKFFSQYSFSSIIILGLFGIIFYNFLLFIADKFFYFIKIVDFNIILGKNYLIELAWQAAINLIFIFILFFLQKSDRLKL